MKMAEAHISVDNFSCPLCLDLLKDPVTLACGHSYCKVCINGCWDQEEEKGIYSCPECRDTFTPRPVLRRNNMLAEVVEKLEKTDDQAVSPAHYYAGPGDVECDFCTGRKHKAVKSCLMCLTSFCETHLKPHLERPALKKHTLIEASSNLQEKICSHHDEVFKIYCRNDQRCICSLCLLENHKGHDTVPISAERTEKQSELKEEQIKSQKSIQDKQEKMQELKQYVNTIKSRAQTAIEENDIIFTEMISSMEKKHLDVTKRIRAQEKSEINQAERLLGQLEQENTELRKRVKEMDKLLLTHDHIHFLQSFQSICISARHEDSPSNTFNQHLSFVGLMKSLSDLKKQFQEFCEEEFNKILPHDFCYLNLDPNTANNFLQLSDTNKVVKFNKKSMEYTDHPDRFDSLHQVLCKERVCGRCYWEVEWSGVGGVYIAVSYKDIRRKGDGKECVFGHNSHSWSLFCSSSSLSFYHNNVKTELRVPSSSRIGVYVDHSAGSLSFYSFSDRMRLIHRVHTTFTQPLYAGFGVCNGSVWLCNPKNNS